MNPMQQMLAQAQKMQRDLKKAHEELNEKEFKVTKGGMVEVSVKGDRSISKIAIDKDAVDPENVEMLQDTLVMALNEALEQVNQANDEIEERITGKASLF